MRMRIKDGLKCQCHENRQEGVINGRYRALISDTQIPMPPESPGRGHKWPLSSASFSKPKHTFDNSTAPLRAFLGPS